MTAYRAKCVSCTSKSASMRTSRDWRKIVSPPGVRPLDKLARTCTAKRSLMNTDEVISAIAVPATRLQTESPHPMSAMEWTQKLISLTSPDRSSLHSRHSTQCTHTSPSSSPLAPSIKVYSAFHPSGVGKWVPVIAGKAKAGMAHSDCGWTCGCAGKNCEIPWEHVPYLSASVLVIHYEEALYQVYAPLPLLW